MAGKRVDHRGRTWEGSIEKERPTRAVPRRATPDARDRWPAIADWIRKRLDSLGAFRSIPFKVRIVHEITCSRVRRSSVEIRNEMLPCTPVTERYKSRPAKSAIASRLALGRWYTVGEAFIVYTTDYTFTRVGNGRTNANSTSVTPLEIADWTHRHVQLARLARARSTTWSSAQCSASLR